MLARFKKLASKSGHLFDFFTDESKAVLLSGALAVRAWRTGGYGLDTRLWAAGDARFLLAGIVGVATIASALSLTNFVRHPEVSGRAATVEAHYETVETPRPSPLALVNTFLRFLNHYPSHIWLWALAGRMEVYLWLWIALFAYVSAMHLLAARMWADDGNAYAEIELGAFDACEALSAAFAPSRGWVVACASSTGTRAQRLREDGTTAWGRNGAWLGVESTVGRAAIAFDTPSSFVVVQRARAIGGDRLLAARFDDEARPLWPAAVHMAALAGGTATDSLRASLAGDGLVRVEAAGRFFEVRSDGQTRSVPR
jgi:hypothetical protein